MPKIIRRAMRLFCLAVGHDWAPPVSVRLYSRRTDAPGNFFRSTCARCDRMITGDREWMAVNHAWSHNRWRDQ